MNGLIWSSSEYLWLLWLLFIVIPILIFSFIRNEKARKSFFGQNEKISVMYILKIIMLVSSLTLMIFAMARPARPNRIVDKKVSSKDTLFVVDVSRSMMAEDIKPSRLSQSILSIADSMETLKGNRLGLMAYAGSSVMLCPLTRDHSFFINALKNLSPASVSRGGSMTGDAFRKIEKDILKNQNGSEIEIILITDGDDQESFPLEAVNSFSEYNVSLLVVGIGNDKEGARIPVYGPDGDKNFLVYQGQEIWSVMNTEMLSAIVNSISGSALVTVTEGSFDFSSIYKGFSSASHNNSAVTVNVQQDELYQMFLLPGFIIMCLFLFSSLERRKK